MLSCVKHRAFCCAARGSALSRAQVAEVQSELRKYHPEIELYPAWVVTRGDRDLQISLKTMEKTDFFTREVDLLLLDNQCRLAIHSAKDLPEPLAQGLQVIAITQGVDPSDSLVLKEGRGWGDLPVGAKIGTSSQRREREICALRPDVQCIDIRGTIETRLQLLDGGEIDAVVIAEAALIRLGLTDRNRIRCPWETAPLQGQLAVVARIGDEEMRSLFACLDTRLETR